MAADIFTVENDAKAKMINDRSISANVTLIVIGAEVQFIDVNRETNIRKQQDNNNATIETFGVSTQLEPLISSNVHQQAGLDRMDVSLKPTMATAHY